MSLLTKDDIVQRINRNVYEDIKYYRNWLIASSNKDVNMSFSETLENMVYELMKHHKIKKELEEKIDIKAYDNMLKSHRIDNNFENLTRQKSEIVRDFLKKQMITTKKISIVELHDRMLEEYVKQYPELEKLINQLKMMQRQPVIDEMVKKQRGY